jgi:hypothetical protein
MATHTTGRCFQRWSAEYGCYVSTLDEAEITRARRAAHQHGWRVVKSRKRTLDAKPPWRADADRRAQYRDRRRQLRLVAR